MHAACANCIAIAEFQSAPGLEAGRCFLGLLVFEDALQFQSAPGLEAGRCAVACRRRDGSKFVSIRARP